MPRFVRNFWMQAAIDGAVSKEIPGSPRADGGFELTILVRKDGQIGPPIKIAGRVVPETDTFEVTVRAPRVRMGTVSYDLSARGSWSPGGPEPYHPDPSLDVIWPPDPSDAKAELIIRTRR